MSEEEEDDIVYEVSSDGQTVPMLVPVAMQSTPALAAMALALTVQEWRALGHGKDPNVAASSNLSVTVERLVSLFLIRIVALVSQRNHRSAAPNPHIPHFTDLSTTTICRASLLKKRPWPKPITTQLIHQLRTYIQTIMDQYKRNHYHNFEHAYHVSISSNKLLDMMLFEGNKPKRLHRRTFGLKNDALVHLALLFSALIHDVEHKGVSNRQLVLESDDLAILYNDQSVAEQRSLAVAFSELQKPQYQGLCRVLFSNPEEYRRFRKTVINLVLVTDIASPERTQLVKSKWKEAFGDTKESMERKARKETSRRSLMSTKSAASLPANWKGTRESSMPRSIVGANRRARSSKKDIAKGVSSASIKSQFSELTMDPSIRYLQPQIYGKQQEEMVHSLTNIHDEDLETDSTSATPESSDDMEKYLPPSSDGIRSPGNARLKEPKLNGALKEPSMKFPIFEEKHEEEKPGDESFVRRNLESSPDFGGLGTGDGVSVSNQTAPPLGRGLDRRFSSPDLVKSKKHTFRLGIRRSLDLTGEAIEHYSHSSRSGSSSATSPAGTGSNLSGSSGDIDFDPDEPDELKAAVVMEHMIRAADVAPNLQGWDHMERWSSRLFFELKSSFSSGRGDDPQHGWFENQITFIESYVLPLARRLEDTGVFGSAIGPMFARIVEENKDRWMTDGLALTSHIVELWETKDHANWY